MGDAGPSSTMLSECVRSNDFLEYSSVALKCAVPGDVIDGVNFRGVGVFTSMGGTFVVAGCSKCSPRIGAFTFSNLGENISVGSFPRSHSCVFNLDMAFWSNVVGGLGLVCFLLTVYAFSSYLSRSPRCTLGDRSIFLSRGATRLTLLSYCKRLAACSNFKRTTRRLLIKTSNLK